MMEISRVMVVEREVQDADGVNRLQLVVPVAAPGLFADGECGIEHATVLEKLLLGLLHLNQELLATVVLAIDIENSLAVKLLRAQLLAVQVGQGGDDLLTGQQRVQETAQQLLVNLRAEQFLESKVGIEIDVSLV